MSGTPLPTASNTVDHLQSYNRSISQSLLRLESDALRAYNTCLDFERQALVNAKANPESKDVICARILGYLILHAPSVAARDEMSKVIHSCQSDFSDLSFLGDTFLLHFIRAFKSPKARTPRSSDNSSRSSFNVNKTALGAAIEQAKIDHRSAKRNALLRDNYRCVVTGRYDKMAAVSNEEKMKFGGGVSTQCAHIVPESTYFKLDAVNKKENAASVLAVLTKFGYDVDRLNGDKVHSLFNVMTMQFDARDNFDTLSMWFEATKVENQYRVVFIEGQEISIPNEEVTFTTPDRELYPLPDPDLLALHAACAKVAHLSGAGEYIDKIDRDMEDMYVLASNGASAEVLTHALLRSGISVYGREI